MKKVIIMNKRQAAKARAAAKTKNELIAINFLARAGRKKFEIVKISGKWVMFLVVSRGGSKGFAVRSELVPYFKKHGVHVTVLKK